MSLRTITEVAGVDLALANYHFGSKDNLLREVIARRARIVHDERVRALERRDMTPAASPSVEAIVTAFLEPLLRRLNGGDRAGVITRASSRSSTCCQSLSVSSKVLDPTALHFINACAWRCRRRRSGRSIGVICFCSAQWFRSCLRLAASNGSRTGCADRTISRVHCARWFHSSARGCGRSRQAPVVSAPDARQPAAVDAAGNRPLPSWPMITYSSAAIAVRAGIVQAHNVAWGRIARAGTWFDGVTRVAIAAETRQAPSCALCGRRKEALSPYAIAGQHDNLGILPERVVEQIHRSADGTTTNFDVSGAGSGRNQGTNPFGINASGEITGYYTDTSGVPHGFLRDVSGNITTFDATGAGTSKGQGTRPFAIDAGGDVTGIYVDTKGTYHGFVRTADRSITSFDAPGAAAILYRGTFPFCIDAEGDVAGMYFDTSGAAHGFVRAANGTITGFNAPNAGTANFQGTYSLGINTAGEIVGLYLDQITVLHGFTRTIGGTIISFDVPGAGISMGRLGGYGALEGSGAFSINDSGVIVGSYLDANSVSHGFIETPTPLTPNIAVTPSSSSITTAQAITVAVSVTGVSGNPTPTGTVTLTSGSYISASTALIDGSATIDIAAGSLAIGTDTLTLSYSGDANYGATTATNTVTVTAAVPPSFAITGAAVSINPGASTGNTSTITVTPSGGFTGNVTLTAAVTSSPTGAQDSPTVSFDSTGTVDITSATAGTATLTISSTGATSSRLEPPVKPRTHWFNAAGASLACLLLFGMPVRRRGRRAMLGLFALFAVLAGGIVACNGSSGKTGNPGTTAGSYTITVTGVAGATTETGTVSLMVQ